VEKSFNNVSNSVCTVTVVASPNPLSATPLPSSAMKTSENTKEEPVYPEPEDEGDIQMEFSSD
jgi:hypothetical protein